MISRLILVLLAAFWLTMNFLLWRAEYGRDRSLGSPVPAAVVCKKILTAPDTSSLTIQHHGKRVGFCQWVTSVGEAMSRIKEEGNEPEGMIEQVAGYRIQVEGNFAWPETGPRARFEANLKLSPKRRWQELHGRINLGSARWEVHTVAAEQTLRLKADDTDGQFERVFTFEELQNPERLLQEFAGPFAAGVLQGLGFGGGRLEAAGLESALNWQAREVVARIGHAPVRAYRMEARLLDHYPLVVFVSRVGEILRVELPEDLVLINDQLANF